MKTLLVATLTIEVDNNGVSPEWLKENVRTSLERMIGGGGVTGSSEAECESWGVSITTSKPLQSVSDLNYHRFPNGKVWKVDDKGLIEGTVFLTSSQDDSLEGLLNQISETVTGSEAGLMNFSYRPVGDSIYAFSGSVAEMLEEESEDIILVTDLDDLIGSLQRQYALTDVEVVHLKGSLFNRYENETSRVVSGGRMVHVPAFPEPASYVRVTVDGHELAYWVEDEFKEAPADVIGALLGALVNRRDLP